MQRMHAREELLYLREDANRMQISSWRMDQARWEMYMHSMHEASLHHVQKREGQIVIFSSNNPQRMLQNAYATIVTGSVAAGATKKKATRTFLMRYGIWM
jgi:hypothetical protein